MERMMMGMQLHLKKKEENKAIKSDSNILKVKLPKLVITSFNGTHSPWNQFESEIDSSEFSAVSKLSQLSQINCPLQVKVILEQKIS